MKRGAHHTVETRERIQASHFARREQTRAEAIARVSDPTWRQRHRAAIDAPAVRQRMSAGTKAAYEVPGMRERKLAGLVAAYANPELRRKVSEATKAGMVRAREAKLQVLLAAWHGADKRARETFLSQIGVIAGQRS
jgi:hypothetical protein